MSTRASETRARAISTTCLAPTLSNPTGRRGSISEWSRSRTTWRPRGPRGPLRSSPARQHAGPFERPEHPEGAGLIWAEDPVHLSSEPGHQTLRLLLGRVRGRAGVLAVREKGDLGELLG